MIATITHVHFALTIYLQLSVGIIHLYIITKNRAWKSKENLIKLPILE